MDQPQAADKKPFKITPGFLSFVIEKYAEEGIPEWNKLDNNAKQDYESETKDMKPKKTNKLDEKAYGKLYQDIYHYLDMNAHKLEYCYNIKDRVYDRFGERIMDHLRKDGYTVTDTKLVGSYLLDIKW